MHFRLSRRYENEAAGLLLPVENLTSVGLSRRFKVVHSYSDSNSEAILAANRSSPKTGRNFDVFCAGDPLEIKLKAANTKKARERNKERRLSYLTCKSVQNYDL
jgi:hypothetical protein